MAQTLALLIGLVIVAAGAALIVMSVGHSSRRSLERSPQIALQVGDLWYRQAVRMARLLEQLRRDDMVAVTVPDSTKQEIDEALSQFWKLHTR